MVMEQPEKLKLDEVIVVTFIQQNFLQEDFDVVMDKIAKFMAKFLFPRYPEQNEFAS